MKILKEISDGSLGTGEVEQFGQMYELRKSARAILLNENGEMAVQYLNRDSFHKLPGGGVDQNETIEEALKREIKEEVGCDCKITKEVGTVIEYRNEHKLIHVSYCYITTVVGEINEPQLEQCEIDEGMETVWMKPEEALKKMQTDVPTNYQGPFILQREMAFLEDFLSTQ